MISSATGRERPCARRARRSCVTGCAPSASAGSRRRRRSGSDSRRRGRDGRRRRSRQTCRSGSLRAGASVSRLLSRLQVGSARGRPPVASVRFWCIASIAFSTPAERSTSHARFRARLHGMNQRRLSESLPSAASMPAPSQSIRLRSGVSSRRCSSSSLSRCRPNRRAHAAVQIRLDRVEQQVREAVVLDDEALVPEAAVGEVEHAGDGRAGGLPDVLVASSRWPSR